MRGVQNSSAMRILYNITILVVDRVYGIILLLPRPMMNGLTEQANWSVYFILMLSTLFIPFPFWRAR